MAKDNGQPLQLQLSRNIFNEKFYPMLLDYTHRWEVYKGSAGSGKSHFISQKLLIKAISDPNRRILVCRRYGSTVRETVWQLIIEQLRFFKLEDMCQINKTDRTIVLPNGSMFIFFGLDDETKLLSLQNISDVWVEEVFECNRDIVEQLSLRMRGTKANQQLYLSFNPISASHWLYDFCEVNSPKSFIYHQSTFRDNRFLPEAYVESLEDLYRTNPVKARVFCDGEWGVDFEGLVYPNHVVEEFDVEELIRTTDYPIKVGVDIGFRDPSTCVVSLWDKPNRRIYIISEYYKRGATFEEVCEGIKLCTMSEKQKVYVDNADPRAIQYFQQEGIHALPCKKGNDSNKLYMQFLQNHQIICHPSCVHVAEELGNFTFLKDKNGYYMDDKTDHTYSHTLDALKYSYSDVYRSKKLSSLSIKLGL